MPPPKHRKKPFSAKQKKEQLKAKREKKRHCDDDEPVTMETGSQDNEAEIGESGTMSAGLHGVKKVNQQPGAKPDKGYDPNRYRLHFLKDTKEEIEKRKALARIPLQPLSEESLEVKLEDVYQPGSVLDMPKRPPWSYNLSKKQLEAREEAYFRDYMDKILEKQHDEDLSYFELNLETWRQLWRVLEMSDIILLITDIRHPVLHFSPALYDYVTKETKKHLVLVLNKIDLAPPSLVVAWKHYFQTNFPNLQIICFTSYPKDELTLQQFSMDKVLNKRRKKGSFTPVGPKQLYRVCEAIVDGAVDLTSWREKIESDLSVEESDTSSSHNIHTEESDGGYSQHVQYKDGILTLGCCGYPNVGKSSLINGLVGKKVVSVSRTPGHTKHFQTIYLTPSVKLCDSPGLVFPSLVPKAMQILTGMYPIAQVREPYTAVGFLSQHVAIAQVLKLTHPEADDTERTRELPWSALDICDAWAEKRGFFTAKAARHDTYRAANSLLRMAVDGRLIFCMRPPGFTAKKEEWNIHPETKEIAAVQAMHWETTHFSDTSDDNLQSDDEVESKEVDTRESDDDDDELVHDTLITNNPFAFLPGD